jgi:uncharacterized phiE125 gp8 family phage protein
MLQELTTVPSAAWPVAELAEHLRLSRGFADDGSLDAELESCLRAAASAIEARTAKALFRRRFSVTITAWTTEDCQLLPLAPVFAVESVTIVSRTGEPRLLANGAYALVADAHRPAIIGATGYLPMIGTAGHAVIELVAGYADTWAGLPADLRQAVIVMAAAVFGQNVDPDKGLPRAVLALIEPYRSLRLSRVRA